MPCSHRPGSPLARDCEGGERDCSRRKGVSADGDPTAFAAYQEIVVLKVELERETARILSGAAHLGAELVNSAQALRGRTDQAPQ